MEARLIVQEDTSGVSLPGIRTLIFPDGVVTARKGGGAFINASGSGGGAAGDKVVKTFNASVALGGQRAVKVSAGSLVYADYQDIFESEIILGITENAAASPGDPVSVALSGVISEPSWSWTPGLPIYLGATGLLTQTANTTFSSTELGIALTATSMLVRIQETIFF